MKRLSARLYAQALWSAASAAPAKDHTLIVRNLLKLLQRKRAMKLLPRIMDHLQQLEDAAAGRTRVELTLAPGLDEREVLVALERRIGPTVIDVRRDDRLGAGLRLRLDDRLIDASLQTQLQRLHHSLIQA